MRDGFSYIRDEKGNFIPKYQINGVSISEQFAPLIMANIVWNNSLSTRFEYKKSRIINLSSTTTSLSKITTMNMWLVLDTGLTRWI